MWLFDRWNPRERIARDTERACILSTEHLSRAALLLGFITEDALLSLADLKLLAKATASAAV